MTDILDKLNKFESAVITAWTYDTKLDFQEDYISGKKMKKSDEYHATVRQLKSELVTALKEAVYD